MKPQNETSTMEKFQKTLRILYATASVIFLGCQTRAVIVDQGDPVMLADTVSAEVYVYDKDGKLRGPVKVRIPTGWYCLPKPDK